MTTHIGRRLALGLGLSLTTVAALWAADTRRAPPPKFDPATVNDIFFPDARSVLAPGGPPTPGSTPVVGQPAGPGGPASPAAPAGGASDGNKWSTVVSADTLESEIKAQPAAIDNAMKAPNPQKSARMVLTYVAALYGVIYRYDADVRWKSDSQPLRDNFARGGNALKAWTDAQKRLVGQLKTDLSELIQGNPTQLTAKLDGEVAWTEIADRPPLMHRLEMGQSERLNLWVKDADTLKKNTEAVVREGEVMAMLGKIIQDKSYEYADDDTYLGFARDLEAQARAAVDCAKKGDAAGAASAVAKMQKACDDCHGGFR